MKTLILVMAGLLAGMPALAQESMKYLPIQQGECKIVETNESAFEFDVPAETQVFVVSAGGTDARSAADKSQWQDRDAMVFPAGSRTSLDIIEEAAEIHGWMGYRVHRAGRYVVTFSPKSMYGWDGAFGVCVGREPPVN